MSITLNGTNGITFSDSTTQNTSSNKGFRNLLINGNFDYWQRGTSLSAAGYLSDRWNFDTTATSVSQSRVAFTIGQTAVPNEPKYHHRCIVTTTSAGQYASLIQRIERGNKLLSNKDIVVSFWAKADASKNISLEFVQYFGSGGSSNVYTYPVSNLLGLTTSWQKFTRSIRLSDITGKTFGTTVDYLTFGVYLSSDTLSNQTGTFDIAQVQLETGISPSSFEVLPQAEELRRCQRYYQDTSWHLYDYSNSASTSRRSYTLATNMRTTPTVTPSGTVVTNCTSPTAVTFGGNELYYQHIGVAAGFSRSTGTATLSAEL